MVKLYFSHLKQNLKCQLEYKWSFIMSLISQIFVFFTYYFLIISLFTKFNNIIGFSLYVVLLCFFVFFIFFFFN